MFTTAPWLLSQVPLAAEAGATLAFAPSGINAVARQP